MKGTDFGFFPSSDDNDDQVNSAAKVIDQLNDFLDGDSGSLSSDDEPDQSNCSDT